MKTTIRCGCGAKHVVKSTDDESPVRDDTLYEEMERLRSETEELREKLGDANVALLGCRVISAGEKFLETTKLMGEPAYVGVKDLRAKYDKMMAKGYAPVEVPPWSPPPDPPGTSPEGILKRVPKEMNPVLFGNSVRFHCRSDVYEKNRYKLTMADLDVVDLAELNGEVDGEIINAIPF